MASYIRENLTFDQAQIVVETAGEGKDLFYVYKWTHNNTGKWYVGSRTARGSHLDDGYLTSSKIVKPMLEANSHEWTQTILYVGTDAKAILEKEAEYLKAANAKNDAMSFNQHNGDGKFTTSGMRLSDDTRKKCLKQDWAFLNPKITKRRLGIFTAAKLSVKKLERCYPKQVSVE